MEIDWQGIGHVTICDKGWPKFPKVPKLAGLYRLTLKDGRCYIGETVNLSRRLYEYRRPTKGVECEHRLHSALISANGAFLEIFTQENLSDKVERTKLEKRAIQRAIHDGVSLLNDDGPDDPIRLREKIAFHQKEITLAQLKLENLTKHQD